MVFKLFHYFVLHINYLWSSNTDWIFDCIIRLCARQVQKSDRINSDRQSGTDQLGSTRTNSDRIKKNKNKIKLDSDQLGSTKNKLIKLAKLKILTHLEGKKGQIILFFSVACSRHFVLLVPVPLKSCYEPRRARSVSRTQIQRKW